jgi:hypothetical protein
MLSHFNEITLSGSEKGIFESGQKKFVQNSPKVGNFSRASFSGKSSTLGKCFI